MSWTASPEMSPDYSNYLDSLRIVDDAAPFPIEVDILDIRESGYSLDVYEDSEEIESSESTDDEFA